MKFLHRIFPHKEHEDGGKRCLPCLMGAIAVLVIAIIAIAIIFRPGGGKDDENSQLTQKSVDEIVQYGQVLLTQKLNAGEDLSSGPCLDNNKKFSGWVIDIASDPRIEADDDPRNQCSAYRRGNVENFVELSLSGDIIRIFPELNSSTGE